MQLAVGVDLYRSYNSHTVFCMHDSHQKHVARRELCKSYLTYPDLLVSVGPGSIEFVPIPTFYEEFVSSTALSLSVATFFTFLVTVFFKHRRKQGVC